MEPLKKLSGFTLMEILVVLGLLGIILALVRVNLMPDDKRILETESQKLALLLEQARLEAITSGELLAWSQEAGSYRFWRLAGISGPPPAHSARGSAEWTPLSRDELLRERIWDGIQLLDLRINHEAAALTEKLVFSPTGLMLPFRITLGLGESQMFVSGDAAGNIEMAARP